MAAVIASAMAPAGCKPYRVEYHTRPDFYEKASATPLPDEIVLDDGTVIKYNATKEQSTFGRTGDDKKKPLQIREEGDDGKVTLRNLLPQHVLMNLLACMQKEEYSLIWDQLLAEESKAVYEQEGEGEEQFADYCKRNRHDLVAMLTRLVAGLPNQETALEYAGTYARARLRPQFSAQFKLKTVVMVKQGIQWKLVSIK